MTPCGCEDTGIIYAYDVDGVLTQSNDGGVTYTPVPQKDPRNSSPLFPPPMDEDPETCPAADSAVDAIIGDIFNNLLPEMSRAEMEELIKTWVLTYINTSNPFIALVTVITNLIIGLGVEAIIASLTTDVWQKLRCCFNDHMLPDFSFDTDAWEDLRQCVLSDIGGIAGIFLEHLLFLAGKAGCTNLVRAGRGLPDADCDCGDECTASWAIFGDDPTHFHGQITAVADDYIEVISGAAGHCYFLARTPDNMQGCVVTEIEMLTGIITNGGGSFVGEAINEGAPNHFPSDIVASGACMAYIQFDADGVDVQWTARIHFAPC